MKKLLLILGIVLLSIAAKGQYWNLYPKVTTTTDNQAYILFFDLRTTPDSLRNIRLDSLFLPITSRLDSIESVAYDTLRTVLDYTFNLGIYPADSSMFDTGYPIFRKRNGSGNTMYIDSINVQGLGNESTVDMTWNVYYGYDLSAATPDSLSTGINTTVTGTGETFTTFSGSGTVLNGQYFWVGLQSYVRRYYQMIFTLYYHEEAP